MFYISLRVPVWSKLYWKELAYTQSISDFEQIYVRQNGIRLYIIIYVLPRAFYILQNLILI